MVSPPASAAAPTNTQEEGEPATTGASIEDTAGALASNHRRIRAKKAMMYTLGGYSLVNIGTGAAGAVVAVGDAKYLFEMNAMWNGVNMVFAVVGLIGAYRADPDMPGTKALEDGRKASKAYAINMVLDVAYVATGATLLQYGHERDRARLRGWGRSVMIQGGFLLAFDTVLLALTEHENRALLPLLSVDRDGAHIGFAARF